MLKTMTERKLLSKSFIIEDCEKKYGKNTAFMVSTKELGPKATHEWMEKVLTEHYAGQTATSEKPIHFCYIKFATDSAGASYGMAGCVSRFTDKYCSDLNFYDKYDKLHIMIDQIKCGERKKDFVGTAPYHMVKYEMEWDQSEVLFVKAEDEADAQRMENELQTEYHLYD